MSDEGHRLSEDQLVDLFFAMWDGTAGPEQIRLVDKVLARNAAARRLYLQCLEMHLEMSGLPNSKKEWKR
jgi:hypothetical protein